MPLEWKDSQMKPLLILPGNKIEAWYHEEPAQRILRNGLFVCHDKKKSKARNQSSVESNLIESD